MRALWCIGACGLLIGIGVVAAQQCMTGIRAKRLTVITDSQQRAKEIRAEQAEIVIDSIRLKAKRIVKLRLFNGRDLSGWKAYLADPNAKMEDVWRVENGILICKGTPLGYLYTEKDYKNYILRLEWRWAPGKQPGNSGVLLRVHGEHKIWPRSVEAQLMYMNAGDFWLIDGAPLETDPAFVDKNAPRHRIRKKNAEKPAPEWNQYEIIVYNDRIILRVNGETVNEGTGAEVVAGKIALQSEGGEIHFRNIELIVLED
ncbi:MAG: DUF1080 domain-containing protein [Fimbriimonadales bacterium]|nr:DUF1080 domain-containing protein [Fimbriimonadales bacterium]MDW8052449.1 DUF1080 domain-containing protein [Armatimonadota bacterium]